MADASEFQPAREQDAWATLRGFKYQIDLSILRWLSLAPNQFLELERGEDIDVVTRAMSADSDDEFIRILEQVKVRSINLTLRSSSALVALADAHGQFVTNGDLDLRYCFTTNAKVAKERPSPFKCKTAGIELWESIRRRQVVGEHCKDVVSQLREFLSQSARPRKSPEDVWKIFVDFTRDTTYEAFLNLILRFEWSCNQANPSGISDEVRRRMCQHDATSDFSIDEYYDRLLLFVFRLLTQPGLKRLSRQNLTEQFALPTLPVDDHHLINQVHSRFRLFEERLNEIESTVRALSADVQNLARRYEDSFSTIETVTSLSLDSPPLVSHLSNRSQTVADLYSNLATLDWLGIFGSVDTGKTQLCALIANSQDKTFRWVTFGHEMPTSQASLVLHEAMRLIANEPSATKSSETIIQGCEQLRDSILVLDDLPRLASNESFVQLLASLAANRMLLLGEVDDPLLAFTRQLEANAVKTFSETVNVAPLFSCQAAITQRESTGTTVEKQLEQRKQNAETLIDTTQGSGWHALRPSPEFQTGIVLLQVNDDTLRRVARDKIREFFLAHGISVTCYEDGIVRLSMPDHTWRQGELDLLLWTFRAFARNETTPQFAHPITHDSISAIA